jgi:hypothetical protein
MPVAATSNRVTIALLRDSSNGGAVQLALSDYATAFGGLVPGTLLVDLNTRRQSLEAALLANMSPWSAADLRQLGDRLADALLSGDVRILYAALNSGNVEISLSIEDGDLKRIPWEYVVWPDLKISAHKARSITRIVSFLRHETWTPAKLAGSPLNILVCGADLNSMAPIPWDETVEELKGAFAKRLPDPKKWQFDFVEAVDPVILSNALQSKAYHIVHFLGHGEANGIYLRGESAKARGQILTTGAFTAMLQAAKSMPLLVILSACDTGKAPLSRLTALGSIAEETVKAGVPAVVANQMKITSRAVATFLSGLYRGLASTGNIDVAVTYGRLKIVEEMDALNRPAVEMGIPILFRRAGCHELIAP